MLPNGDVLVAETNAPKRPDDNKGLKGWFFNHYQKKAGGAVPSPNRITLLRDADGDGVAETRTVFLSNLNAPFGMALVGHDLYVANTDAVVRFSYELGATQIKDPGVKIVDLPAGTINHHWTKNLIASPDGSRVVRRGRVQQQRGGKRDRDGGESRGDLGDRSQVRKSSRICEWPSKSRWDRVGTSAKRALGRGERAR